MDTRDCSKSEPVERLTSELSVLSMCLWGIPYLLFNFLVCFKCVFKNAISFLQFDTSTHSDTLNETYILSCFFLVLGVIILPIFVVIVVHFVSFAYLISKAYKKRQKRPKAKRSQFEFPLLIEQSLIETASGKSCVCQNEPIVLSHKKSPLVLICIWCTVVQPQPLVRVPERLVADIWGWSSWFCRYSHQP